MSVEDLKIFASYGRTYNICYPDFTKALNWRAKESYIQYVSALLFWLSCIVAELLSKCRVSSASRIDRPCRTLFAIHCPFVLV